MSDSSEDRDLLVRQFTGSGGDYYSRQFSLIGSSSSFTFTFNLFAALLGPIWFGMRGLWHWGLPFVILEAFGVIQIGRGLFGDLGSSARDRISQVEGTLEFRYQQLQSAIDKNRR